MPVIAIDFGGTRIKLGIIDTGGKVLLTSDIKAIADKSIRVGLEQVDAHVRDLLAKNSIAENTITGIGIMMPSIIDTAHNKVVSKYVKYTDAHLFDFNQWARENWNLPVVIANDAKAALIGEWQYGAGRGSNDLVMITLGTGVGTAVLTEGRLLKGKHYLAGNMGGHISINFNGKPCNCGFFGCVETEASTWALPSLIQSHENFQQSSLSTIGSPEFSHLFQEADKGDLLAKHMIDHCLKAWGVCAVNLVHAYDPEKIIISGGIMKRKEDILPFIQHMVDTCSWLEAGTVEVVAAEQTQFAGLLGMEYLVNSSNLIN